MIRKSSIFKLSGSGLFRKIKTDLPLLRKYSRIEARLILKQSQDRLFHDPPTEDFQKFLKLSEEAFERGDFNEAFLQINKTINLFQETSVAQKNPNKLDKAGIYELAGKIYRRNYEIKGSIYLLEKSFKILCELLGEDNIYSIPVIFELAESYFENFMGNEAIFYFTKYLRLRNLPLSRLEKTDIPILFRIGLAYNFKLGPKAALRALKQSFILCQNILAKDYETEFEILMEIGSLYSVARKNTKAIKYYKKCFKILEHSPIAQQISTRRIYDLLTSYYFTVGNHPRSLYYTKKTIKYFKSLKTDCYLAISMMYSRMSINYEEMNNLEKEFYYYDKHMIILKKTVGEKHPDFLFSSLKYFYIMQKRGMLRKSLKLVKDTKLELKMVFTSNMYLKAHYKLSKGSAYLALNQTKKSLKKIEEAKKLFCDNFGENHPNYIHCCYNIGLNLHTQEYLSRALTIYKRVFQKTLTIYPYYHRYNAGILFHIGEVYRRKGRFSPALRNYKLSLQIFSKLDLLSIYNSKRVYISIADLYLEKGENQRFFYYMKKSFDLKNKTNIDKNMYDYSVQFVIAHYYEKCKNWKAAKTVYWKCLKKYLSSDQYNSSDIVYIIGKLIFIEITKGKRNFSKANKLFILSKKIYTDLIEEEEIPGLNPLLIEIYLIKAELYKMLGKFNDCLLTLIKASNLMKQFVKKHDLQMLNIYISLSKVFFEMDKLDESLQMSREALKVELKNFKNPFSIFEICTMIGSTYYISQNFDKALKYLRKSLKYYTKDSFQLKQNYFCIGGSYYRQNQLDRALKYYNLALSSTELSLHMSLEDTCFWNAIAIVYAYKKLLTKALRLFKICLENAIANKFKYRFIQIFTYNVNVIENPMNAIKKRILEGNQDAQDIPESFTLHFKHAWRDKND